jgi:hypothetical protein
MVSPGFVNAVLTGDAFAFIGSVDHNAFARANGKELHRGQQSARSRISSATTGRRGVLPMPGTSAWLAEREAELLPVPYFHVVFTLPAAIADIAYQNKAVIYDLSSKGSGECYRAGHARNLRCRLAIGASMSSAI